MSRARDLAAFVSNADGDIKFDTDTLFIDSSANRVGIGTSTPSAPLHIEGADDALATIESTDRYSHVNLVDSLGASRVTNDSGNLRLRADNANSAASSYLTMEVDGTEAMRIDENGKVGIGTASPARPFSVTDTTGDGTGGMILASYLPTLEMDDISGGGTSFILQHDTTNTIFKHDTTERMRIDSSGNLLVGKTSADFTASGVELRPNGQLFATQTGNYAAVFNRKTSSGDVVSFRKDGTTIGSWQARGGLVTSLVMDPRTNGGGLTATTGGFYVTDNTGQAGSDNTHDWGQATVRFDDIYATNGTIQTSDRNEKQDIAELDEAEKRVATAAKGLIRKYRWIDAVQEKGDEARIHVGIIAQDLQAAFEAEGLDAGRYAMFISSTWWEADEVIPAVEAQEAVYETQTDEEGNETQVLVSEAVEAQPERTVTNTYETQEEAPEGATERTRLGVRYPELLAFIIGAM